MLPSPWSPAPTARPPPRRAPLPPSSSPSKALPLWLLVSWTLLGNAWVLLAVLGSRRLRSRPTHLFVASLAASDLLVASLVMPWKAASEVAGRWPFGAAFCRLWVACDILCSTASILHLCLISVERYWAIARPFGYQRRMSRRVALGMVAAAWALASLLSFLPVQLGWHQKQQQPPPRASLNRSLDGEDEEHEEEGKEGGSGHCDASLSRSYAVASSLVSFYIPVAVMMVAYGRIYRIARLQIRRISSLERAAFHAQRRRSQHPRHPTSPPPQDPYNPSSHPPQDPNSHHPQDPNSPHPRNPNSHHPQNINSHHPQNPNSHHPQDPNSHHPQDPKSHPPQDPYNPSSHPPQDPNSHHPQDPNSPHPRNPNSHHPQDPNSHPPQDPNSHHPQDPNSHHPQDPNSHPPQNPYNPSSHPSHPPQNTNSHHPQDPNSHPPQNPNSHHPQNPNSHPPQNHNSPPPQQHPPSPPPPPPPALPSSSSLRREAKVLKTLSLLMGVFVCCWLPFFVLNCLLPFCPTEEPPCVSQATFDAFVWVGWANSALNPLIYASDAEFRKVFAARLLCRRGPRRRRRLRRHSDASPAETANDTSRQPLRVLSGREGELSFDVGSQGREIATSCLL